jgi:hypothetical protein
MLANATDARDRVYATREVPWRTVELPGLSVYSLEENPSDAVFPPLPVTREVTVAILGLVQLSEGVDDAIDALALQVEKAIGADPTLGGTALQSRYSGATIGTDVEGRRPVGVIRITYAVQYDDASVVARGP